MCYDQIQYMQYNSVLSREDMTRMRFSKICQRQHQTIICIQKI